LQISKEPAEAESKLEEIDKNIGFLLASEKETVDILRAS
jgi:hypothetical protein